MKSCTSIWLWLTVLLFSVQSLGSERSDVAYVTLLYGDEFLLGIRVLGKSIRDTGSIKDMVVLVSDGVSDYANNVLEVLLSFASCISAEREMKFSFQFYLDCHFILNLVLLFHLTWIVNFGGYELFCWFWNSSFIYGLCYVFLCVGWWVDNWED